MLRDTKRSRLFLILRVAVIMVLLSFFSISAYASENVVNEVRYIINNYYVDKVSNNILAQPTIDSMIKSLGDPHTQYFTAEEYKAFSNNINMSFSGIGAYFEIVSQGIKVTSVIKGSPAEEVGLLADDIIIKADRHILAGLSTNEVASYIKGTEGTTVTLKVLRKGKYYTYDVVRKEITTPTVEREMLDEGTGYIRILSFGENTDKEFRSKLAELDKNNPNNYIVDLRNNGGGYLHTAIDIAGSFIGANPLVHVKSTFNGEDTYFAPGSVGVINKPIILLINNYSASASELLAAAVKDYKTAFLIGTNTYGKGTVQSLFDLSDGSVLKMTVQRFYSPLGNTIDKVGVSPDLEVQDIDPLLIAELLSAKNAAENISTGYMGVKMGGRTFEIDLYKARLPEYWKAFKYIIDKAVSAGYEVNINGSGWNRASSDYLNKMHKAYYPEYKEMPQLDNVSVNKKFTITFTQEIDQNTINDKSIELVNEISGERVPLNFEVIDNNKFVVTPRESLKPGEAYYLTVNNSVTAKAGNGLKDCVIMKVSVEK